MTLQHGDIYFVAQESSSYPSCRLFRYSKANKELTHVANNGLIKDYGYLKLYLGADGCIYRTQTANPNIYAMKSGTYETVSIKNYTDISGESSMFTYKGKTYVMNVGKALGTIENGVYTPLNVGTIDAQAVRNDNILHAYDDGTLILGAYDNREGKSPAKYYLLSYGITVVNINTGAVTYLRGNTENNIDSFSRAIPLPSGNLLLIGSMGRTYSDSSSYAFNRTTLAVYNKALNEIQHLVAGSCDWNYMFTDDRSKIIITKGSQMSFFDNGSTSITSWINRRLGGGFGIFDVATETYENKAPEFVKGNFYYDKSSHMVKSIPYRLSNGKYVILASVGYSDTVETPVGDYARLYDESTDSFIQLSQKCFHYLAQTSVGDYSSNDLGHLVKYNTVLNDFEEVPEVNTVDVGALLDYRETNNYIYFVGRKYIVYYNKTTGIYQAVLSNYGGIVLPAISGAKYVYNTTKTAYNPVTGYSFALGGNSYSKVVQTNKAKTKAVMYDVTNQRILIS